MAQKFRILLIIALVSTALGFLANLAVDNPYSRQLIRNTINDKLAQVTNLEADFKAVSLKFLPLGVEAYGVQVFAEDDPIPVVESARISLQLTWSSLFIGQLQLATVKMHELKFAYPLPASVEFNPDSSMVKRPKETSQDKVSWPPNFRPPITRLILIDSTIHYRLDHQGNELLQLAMEGLNIDLNIERWQNWDMDFGVNRLNLSVEEKHLIRDMRLETRFHGRNHKISSQYFKLSSHQLELMGLVEAELELLERKFDPLGTRLFYQELIGFKLNHKFKVERGDLAILGNYLDAGQSFGPFSGLAQLNLHVPFDNREVEWSVDGRAQSHGALLSGFKLLDSQIRFLINDQGFYFLEAEVIDGETSLAEGSGEILFDSKVPFSFSISPHQLPFGKLLSILQVEDFVAFQSELNARDLTLSGTALPFQMQLLGTGHFHNISSPVNAYEQHRFPQGPQCSLNIDLRINIDHLRIHQGDGYCSPVSPPQVRADSRDDHERSFSKIDLNGHFTFDTSTGMDFKVSLDKADLKLAEHFTNMSMRGTADVHAHLKGPYDRFQIQLNAESEDLKLHQRQYEAFIFDGHYSSEHYTMEINQVQLTEVPNSHLECQSCSLIFHDTTEFKGKILAQHLSPETIKSWLRAYAPELDLEFGVRSLESAISGPINSPDQIFGSVKLELNDLRLGSERLLSLLQVQIERDSAGITVPRAYARLDLLELEAKISHKHHTRYQRSDHFAYQLFGIGELDPIKISLQTISTIAQSIDTTYPTLSEWNHFWSLPYVGGILKSYQIASDIQLQTDLDGTIKGLEGQVQGSFENLFALGSPMASINYSGFIRGSRLNLPVIRHSGNSLIGRINLDLFAEGLPFEWYFEMKQFDFRALLGPSFAKDPRNFAYLTANWQMKGQLAKWWASQGEFQINNIAITTINEVLGQIRKIELFSDHEIAMIFDQSGWNFVDGKALSLEGDNFTFEIKAQDNKPPENLDISFQSRVDVEILRDFFPQIETARGQIQLVGTLAGSVQDPNIQVTIRDRKFDPFQRGAWEPLSIGLADFPPAFTNVNLDAIYDNGILRFNRLTANKGQQGNILISGNLNLTDPEAQDSQLMAELERIEVNRVELPILNAADTILSGSLSLSGSRLPLRLAGDIELNRLHSVGNFDLRRQIIQTFYRKRYSAPISARERILDLDIEVHADKSLYVRNRNMEATLSADLRIQGSDIEPIVLGQISTETGNFIYKRTFDLTRGIISFDEPISPPDPKLDIIGEVQVDGYNVEVIMGGTASDPRVSFSIDPPSRPDGTPISNVDIIVLLTSGQLPVSSDTSPLRVASNEALSLFVGFAEGPLEKIFDASGQSFVRQVYIDSYLSETESRPITRLNLPIHINEDLRIIFQVDDDENFKQSFQYSLHENINVSGSIDKKKEDKSRNERNLPADTVLDLKFRFKFD